MKVWPRTDAIRKVLSHPIAGKFREEGPADWPEDTFTHRLVLDGDLLTSEPPAEPAETPKPKVAKAKE